MSPSTRSGSGDQVTILYSWDLLTELHELGIQLREGEPKDQSFVYFDQHWFAGKFLHHWKHRVLPTLRYREDGNDCDNYVAEFLRELRVAIGERYDADDILADIAGAYLEFWWRDPALGLRPTSPAKKHAQALVKTTGGWLVVEPQNALWCLFQNHPNRAHLIQSETSFR